MEKSIFKKAYQLYWEYLKRSALYRDYCTWRREWQKGHEFSLEDLGPMQHLPDKFKEHFEEDGEIFFQEHPVHNQYSVFRDIHNNTFDEWWEKHGANIESEGTPFKTRWKTTAVSDASDHVLEYYDNFVSYYEKVKGRPPTINEIRSMLRRKLTTDSQYIYKAIRVDTAKTKETIYLKEYKKQRQAYFNFIRSIHGDLSLTKLNPTALEEYLLVYDTYGKPGKDGKKRTMADVVLEIGSEEDQAYISGDPNDKAVLNKYYLRKKKAEIIIGNAERGRFPEYD